MPGSNWNISVQDDPITLGLTVRATNTLSGDQQGATLSMSAVQNIGYTGAQVYEIIQQGMNQGVRLADIMARLSSTHAEDRTELAVESAFNALKYDVQRSLTNGN